MQSTINVSAAETTWTELSPATTRTPDISIIFPAYKRPDAARNLLRRLGEQNLAPEAMEILGVDDGSPEPLIDSLADISPPCATFFGRKRNGGPGSARNAALERARGRYVLILNDDAIPAEDLVLRHLEAQSRLDVSGATLGTFAYSEAAQRRPFVRFVEDKGLTFGYGELKPGAPTDFWSFWTCNICVEREHLEAVGGFDESFPDAMFEDVELGWRLQRDRGVHVYFVPEARCTHDHELTVDEYAKRQRRMGSNCYRAFKKYGNPSMLSLGTRGGHLPYTWLGPFDRRFFLLIEASAGNFAARGRQALEALRQLDTPGETSMTAEQFDDYEAALTRWCFLSACAASGVSDPDLD